MATTTSTRSLRPERARPPLTFPVLLGLLCLFGGLSLILTVFEQVAALGGDGATLIHLMAMNQPATSDLGEALGPAGDSVDSLAFIATLAWICVAAVLMIVAAGYFLTTAHLHHRDAARRVAAVGLWMALAVALISVVPFDAGWSQAGIGAAGGGLAGEAMRTGVIALLGLLLLQISAPQWRASVREAFRD